MAIKTWKSWPEGLRLLVGAGAMVGVLCGMGKWAGVSGDGIYKSGLLIGGLAGLLLAAKRTKTAQEAARISQEGQITDRFSKAVEQLGNGNVSVRIGALYALKRIAEDSPDRDHRPALNIIMSFIKSPWPYPDVPGEDASDELTTASDLDTAIEIFNQLRSVSSISLPNDYITYLDGINLRYFNLRSVDFRNIRVSGGSFKSSLLPHSDFSYSTIRSVSFIDANLGVSKFIRTNAGNSNFHSANLKNARFDGASARYCVFCSSSLQAANFEKADLSHANFSDARANKIHLEGAILHSVLFDHTDLRKSNMRSCDALRTDIIESRLQEANLSKSRMYGCTIKNSSFKLADFSESSITRCKFTDAILDSAIFTGTLIQKCTFEGTDLSSCNFTNADMRYCTFPGAWFYEGRPPVGLSSEISSELLERAMPAEESEPE